MVAPWAIAKWETMALAARRPSPAGPGPANPRGRGERHACDAQISSGCCFTFSSVLPGFGKFWPIWAVILGTGNNAAAPGLARPRPATRGRASWFGAPCVGCCYRTSHAQFFSWHHSCTQLCGCCPLKKNEKDPGLAGAVLTLKAAPGPCTIPAIGVEPQVCAMPPLLHIYTAICTAPFTMFTLLQVAAEIFAEIFEIFRQGHWQYISPKHFGVDMGRNISGNISTIGFQCVPYERRKVTLKVHANPSI